MSKLDISRTFYAEGTNTAAFFVPQSNGWSRAESLWYTSPAAGTLEIFRARSKTTAYAAAAASQTLVIDTDASGYVGGAVLTTDDFVLVSDTTGTGFQYSAAITNVAAVSSNTVTLTLTNTVTCAAGDTIFVVRVADVVSLTTANETAQNLAHVFSSYLQMPLYVLLSATGACQISAEMEFMKRS